MKILHRTIGGIELRDLPYLRPAKLLSWYDHALTVGYFAASAAIAVHAAMQASPFIATAALLAAPLTATGFLAVQLGIRLWNRNNFDKEHIQEIFKNKKEDDETDTIHHPHLDIIRPRLEKALSDYGYKKKIIFQNIDDDPQFSSKHPDIPRAACLTTLKNSTTVIIVLNKSILDLLKPDELEGILQHEMTHSMRNNFHIDAALLLLSAASVGTAFLSQGFRPACGIALYQMLVFMAQSRAEECRADRGAVLLTGKSDSVSSGLGKFMTQLISQAYKHRSGLYAKFNRAGEEVLQGRKFNFPGGVMIQEIVQTVFQPLIPYPGSLARMRRIEATGRLIKRRQKQQTAAID